MRNAAIKRLLNIARNDKNVILMVGDLGYGVTDGFRSELPDQFLNAGICEQNMTSVAAGMALEGKTVFTYSIANFPTLRAIEQVRNDVAYHNVNVKIIAVGCGFAYGSLGMSHHATEDLSMMRALPNMTVFAPGDLAEAEEVMEASYRHQGPCYIRLGKGGEPRIHKSLCNFTVGKALRIVEGDKVCIFSTGGILSEAVDARQKLQEIGLNPAVYSFPTVKPIDAETICRCAKTYDLIFTLEEHTVVGGFGGAVSEVVAGMSGARATVERIGLNDVYPSVVGNQEYLRDHYGLSANHLVAAVKSAVRLS